MKYLYSATRSTAGRNSSSNSPVLARPAPLETLSVITLCFLRNPRAAILRLPHTVDTPQCTLITAQLLGQRLRRLLCFRRNFSRRRELLAHDVVSERLDDGRQHRPYHRQLRPAFPPQHARSTPPPISCVIFIFSFTTVLGIAEVVVIIVRVFDAIGEGAYSSRAEIQEEKTRVLVYFLEKFAKNSRFLGL